MGWRDVERDFYAGKISYAPKKKSAVDEGIGTLIRSIGAGMEGRFKQEQMMRLEEEAERKKKREEAAAAQKAEEQKNAKRLKAAKSIVDGLGLDSNNPNFTNHVYNQLQVENDDVSGVRTLYQDLIKDGRLGKLAAASVYRNRGPKPPEIEAQMDEAFKESMSDLQGPREPKGVRKSLANTESRGTGDLTAKNVNPDGSIFAGRYQFGDDRLADYNAVAGTNYTAEGLLKMPEEEQEKIQEKIADWHFSDISKFIKSEGLDKYIGTEINGVTLTESSLVAVAHLGGKSGLKQFLLTDGKYNKKDSNGTSLTDYARTHAMAGGLEETSTAGDRTQETFIIKPPRPDAVDKDDPTSFEQMLVQSLQNDPSFQALPRQEQQQRIAAAKQTLMKQSQGETTLTSSALAFKIANAEKVKMDPLASAADKEAAEKYLIDEAPIEKAAIESAAVSNKSPDTITAIIRNADGSVVQRDGTLVDGTFVPLGKEKLDLEDGQTLLMLQTPEKISEFAKELSRTKNERDKVGQDLDSAIEVTRTAYDLEQIVAQNPEILTFMGGAVQSTAQTLATEMKALINHVESAFSTADDGRMAATMSEEEVLNSFNSTILDKLSSADPETVEAYRRFNAKMTRFIFAAGKALGQSGNGFSNQDYINIRNSMLSGNLDRDFFNNMREFSRERLISADLATERYFKAGNMTFINSFEFAPYFMGNEGQTAKQYFDDLQRDTESDFNYYQWANSSYNGASPRADANIETLSRSKEDRAKWDAAPSGTNFNVQQRDGTYVTVTKP